MTDASSPTRYVLVWLDYGTTIDGDSVARIRRDIEDTVAEASDQVEIDLWLESPGGDAHAAYKLALMLRHAADYIRVVVPDYAKSAATLLALVGDEIYLAPGSELGPLDAQVPDEGSLIGAISALNIARAADEVAQDAVALAHMGARSVVRRLGLSRGDALEAMLGFSATFSEPLVRQLDPRIVHQAKELLRVTVQYAERLLTKTTGNRAESIAKRLVEDFPTHGFVISRDEARRLGLPVRSLEEYDQLDRVRVFHRNAEDGDAMVCFVRLTDLIPSEDEGGEDEDGSEKLRQDGAEIPASDDVGSDGHQAAPQGPSEPARG